MANGQTIHENGSVRPVVQFILTVSAPLIVAGIIGLVVLVLDVRSKLDLQIQAATYEHTDFERRLSALEREWESGRNDN